MTFCLHDTGVDIFVPKWKKLVTIFSTNAHYDEIVNSLLSTGKVKLELLRSRKGAVKDTSMSMLRWSKNALRMTTPGIIYYKDKVVSDSITSLVRQLKDSNTPWDHVKKFILKMIANQNENGIEQLLRWIKENQLTIIDNGNFIAYKSVTASFKDHHTGTFDNSIGKEVVIDQVDKNPNITCSYGLHVANYSYASTFGSGNSKVLVVEVDPLDVGAVPNEPQSPKIRVYKYKVLALVEDKEALKKFNLTSVAADKLENICTQLYASNRERTKVSAEERSMILQMFNEQHLTVESIAGILHRMTTSVQKIIDDAAPKKPCGKLENLKADAWSVKDVRTLIQYVKRCLNLGIKIKWDNVADRLENTHSPDACRRKYNRIK